MGSLFTPVFHISFTPAFCEGTMSDDFDPTPYVRPPQCDVASGFALGVALLSAVPKGAPENVRKAAKKLRTATVDLRQAWSSSGRSAPMDKRPADIRVDKAWGALYSRLDAYASLPAGEHKRAKRAAELLDVIYPDGLQFLTLPYNAEWAEGEKRLKLIEEDELAEDIDALAGPEFLAEVRKAHRIYGEAIGVTRPAAEAKRANLVDPLRALGRAITQYALQVIAMVDDEKPESIALVKRALRPIDDHRADAAHRVARADKEDQPPPAEETAVPEVA
jgi:hypothetical protein